MAKRILTDFDFGGVARVLALPNGASPQEPATVAQLNAAVEGLAWKDSVRVRTQGNINLASPGAAIDGVAMVANDAVLVGLQSAPAQSGIYVWNGAGVPMTRRADANTAAELKQAVVTVEEGTDAGTTWRQTAVNFVIETDPITWTSFSSAVPDASETVKGKVELATQAEVDAGADAARVVTPLTLKMSPYSKRKGIANLGDNSATQFDITHNFGTRDVVVEVYRNSGAYDSVMCDVSRPDPNNVRINFAAPPSANQYTAVVIG